MDKFKTLPEGYLPARGQYPLFIKKLREETSWSASYAEWAVGEYLKFLTVILNFGPKQTPSKVVDEVWHLHLQFTKDYWEYLCPKVLGFSLHHVPADESMKSETEAQYIDTLANYEAIYGEAEVGAFRSKAKRNFKLSNIGPYSLVAILVMMMGAPKFTFFGHVSGPDFLLYYGVLLFVFNAFIFFVKNFLREEENKIAINTIVYIVWFIVVLVGVARMIHGYSHGYPVGLLFMEMAFLAGGVPVTIYSDNIGYKDGIGSGRNQSDTGSCSSSSCSSSCSSCGGGCGGCGGD